VALVAVFLLLALFAILSIVMSAEDSRRPDPRDDPLLWTLLGRR
jgi:hypothetical protein